MDQLTENSELGAPKLPRSTVPGVWQSRLDLRVSQNTAALLGERISGFFSSTGTSILLARFLGRERPGQYGAVYVCLSPYGSSAKFCLEQILSRETKVRRHQAAEIFDTMTLTFLGFSLAGSILALLHAPLFGYSGPLRWPLGPALAVAFSLVLHHLFFWRTFLMNSLASPLGALLTGAIERAVLIRLRGMFWRDLANV